MIKKFNIQGMTCDSCEKRIKKNILKLEHIKVLDINAKKGILEVEYDENKIEEKQIIDTIIKTGYSVVSNKNKTELLEQIVVILIFIAIFLIIKFTVGFNFIPTVSNDMNYGLLFIVGLLSSLHCVSMCGGIAISQGLKEDRKSNLKSSLLYNLGRLISYSLLGGIIGFLGSVLTLSSNTRILIPIISGIFMILLGLKLFGLISFSVPNINFIGKTIIKSKLLNRLKINKISKSFFIGLLNGFMPCGPLQTMQMYAVGTASFISGSLSLFFFALGTLPLMFLFGSINSLISAKTSKMMIRFGGLIVVVLGLVLISRGLTLSGVSIPLINNDQSSIIQKDSSQDSNTKNNSSKDTSSIKKESAFAPIENGYQKINMTVNGSGYHIEKLKIKKGIPVKLIINAEQLVGCSNPVTIPNLKIQKKLNQGLNIIEFTPNESGKLVVTCSMGMISSYIIVE